EAKNVTAERIAANFGGENAATFSKMQVDLNPFGFRANVEGDTALDLVGGWFGFKELFGQAQFSGPVRFRSDEVTAEFKIAADPFGYGDLVAPYGTPVTAAGTLAMNLDTKAGSVKPLRLAVGENTTMASPGFDLKFSPFSLDGPVEITTDFYPVVALGMLEGFTGTGSFNGPIAVKDGAFQCDLASEVSAQEILLPARVLALADATFTGQLRRDGAGLGGEGSLRVGQALIAGAAIAGVAGPVRFEGENVVLENLEGQVFGGTVRMTAVLGVLAEGRPIRLQGALSGIDLGAFTAEVKPPQVVLTGMASGNFTIAFTNGAISELQVTLESNEGFSMNKDAVARVLMEQQLIDMTGGKQMQKIVEDVLGKSEQRPFERAKIDLSLREGRVVGPAQLESKGLNLTVDILADWSAIMEGLKIRQRDLS
ncbi:MAG: YdbH domain-containing protein, partial [Candidatus Hydrogenedentes bacterium]|nr:YdbH domain-containing protein [Candidatus Hydrogenedentota bacterium]